MDYNFTGLKEWAKDKNLPWLGQNSLNHPVLIDHGRDPRGEFYRVKTFEGDDYVTVEVFYSDGYHTSKTYKWTEEV